MSVDTNRQDFLIGLLVVTTIAVVIGALIATSGWGERRYDLFLRVASAQGLSADSRVIVQGLQVGRVTSISPRVEATSGRISFVARLSVAERFADGSQLRLPVGTRAEIVQASAISPSNDVMLVLPDTVGRTRLYLGAEDTIDSRRRGTALEALSEVAEDLSKQVEEILRQTARTLGRIQRTLADVSPGVDSTLDYVAGTMGRLNALVARLEQTGVPDSVSTAVASTNRLLRRLDSLATEAQTLTVENRTDLRETVQNLHLLSRQLNHFVDEMSRRPYRLLTGVKPLPADSPRAADSTVARNRP